MRVTQVELKHQAITTTTAGHFIAFPGGGMDVQPELAKHHVVGQEIDITIHTDDGASHRWQTETGPGAPADQLLLSMRDAEEHGVLAAGLADAFVVWLREQGVDVPASTTHGGHT